MVWSLNVPFTSFFLPLSISSSESTTETRWGEGNCWDWDGSTVCSSGCSSASILVYMAGWWGVQGSTTSSSVCCSSSAPSRVGSSWAQEANSLSSFFLGVGSSVGWVSSCWAPSDSFFWGWVAFAAWGFELPERLVEDPAVTWLARWRSWSGQWHWIPWDWKSSVYVLLWFVHIKIGCELIGCQLGPLAFLFVDRPLVGIFFPFALSMPSSCPVAHVITEIQKKGSWTSCMNTWTAMDGNP